MSMNVTSSVSSTASTAPASGSQTENTKTSTDSSFKDEMNKVSTTEKEEKNTKEVTSKKDTEKVVQDKNNEKVDVKINETAQNQNNSNNLTERQNKLSSLTMKDANYKLSNDIQQMIDNNINLANQFDTNIYTDEIGTSIYNLEGINTRSGIINLDFSNNLSMTEGDAQFFVNLVQNDTVNAQAVVAQAQMALDNGVEFSQVQQNVKISETLLNAINIARETNQPLRIDFDQNIAVILRMGKDGSFAANFIPGDKVVEQYLKNNIETLKTAFDEKEIPYTDLSYSNRGSKRQKEERNNQR